MNKQFDDFDTEVQCEEEEYKHVYRGGMLTVEVDDERE